MMTGTMKRWIHDHGLTGAAIAAMAGMQKRAFYDQLSGIKPAQPELRKTLLGIYGMTEQEYEEAMP